MALLPYQVYSTARLLSSKTIPQHPWEFTGTVAHSLGTVGLLCISKLIVGFSMSNEYMISLLYSLNFLGEPRKHTFSIVAPAVGNSLPDKIWQFPLLFWSFPETRKELALSPSTEMKWQWSPMPINGLGSINQDAGIHFGFLVVSFIIYFCFNAVLWVIQSCYTSDEQQW